MNDKPRKHRSRRFTLPEVSEVTGIEIRIVVEWVSRDWVHPADQAYFDEEDVARLGLIRDLRSSLGANDEAIPVILHLLDQLYSLRAQVARLADSK